MLAAVETMTKADPVWGSRRHDSDIAAQATARESVHAASPLKSNGRNVYDEPRRASIVPGASSGGEGAHYLAGEVVASERLVHQIDCVGQVLHLAH